jgi:hypothetical protein
VFAGPFSIGGADYLGAGREIELPGGEFEGPGYARNNGLGMQGFARYNHGTPVPWRGAKGQFSSAQRRFEGIQPYGRRNPLAHNNPSTERLITLSNFLARGARANAGELMGSTPRIPEEVMHLRTLRKRGAKGRLSAMEIELRDQSRTSDSGLLDYIRWLDTGKPKKLGWTKKQIKDYRALAMKEARRRVGIKTSRIIRHKGSKIGFGLKRQSEYGEKWPERRRRRIMAEASERYHEAEREEWISRLRGWQLAAHDLGIPFVGRKKEAVLLDIADEIGVDVGDIKATGAKRTRRPRKKAVANARRVMSAGQWSQVESPSAQRKLERLEDDLEELEDQPKRERRRRLVRIAGRGKKVVGAPRRALERAHREREAEEFMEKELRKLRRNPG